CQLLSPLPNPVRLRRKVSTSRRFTVALPDFIFALCALLGSLLIPFTGLYALLRLKRRAVSPVVSRSVPAQAE
ncbi:hypothetical protein, partial [Streptomyces sp.]|uniref:hypothetical protein n=1 Tax=Streptomyces sp. TaxID=1931 RepID=UPI00281124D9